MTTALFSPYKAVGHVTDGNPFCINRLGEETFLSTSIGKAFQVLLSDPNKQNMEFVSEAISLF
jgi:hypothetical protein